MISPQLMQVYFKLTAKVTQIKDSSIRHPE
jgi:hypothetical protein